MLVIISNNIKIVRRLKRVVQPKADVGEMCSEMCTQFCRYVDFMTNYLVHMSHFQRSLAAI